MSAVVEAVDCKHVDLSRIIGVYPICNTGAVLVYEIDYADDRVLAGINDSEPRWCNLIEEYYEYSGEQELGFFFNSFFVPLYEVQRFYGS